MGALAIISPEIWQHAVETFGSESRAMRWMRQPLGELNERTPEDVLREGNNSSVEAILSRIDYGVYG
jgi:uncharacterized protein (DUF2384 family)